MKTKMRFWIPTLVVALASLFLVTNCTKNDDDTKNAKIPVLTTKEVTEVTQATATSGGVISSDGGSTVTARGVCWSAGQTPTILNNKTIDGTGTGEFSSSLVDLLPSTTYNVRAYATNSSGTSYGNNMFFTTQQGSFTDPRDGKLYLTVIIGKQVWMAENLAYLPSVVGSGTDFKDITTPYYYVYGYDGTDLNAAKATSNYTSYGVLYNWLAAMAGSAPSSANPSGIQGVCPTGWHMPSDMEWAELSDFLGGAQIAGGKLKEAGTTHWHSPNEGATNETGFTARPGGWSSFGTFDYKGNNGDWWSTTAAAYGPNFRKNRHLSNLNKGFLALEYEMGLGLSVRCIRD